MGRFSLIALRVAAAFVFVAGVLHLLMTGHLMHWFAAMTLPHAGVAQAAMLLNHLVVGILLLPLAVSIAAVAIPLSKGEPWALVIGGTSSVALLALPVVLLITVRGPMLEAPAFVAAAILLSVAGIAVTVSVTHLFLSAPRPDKGR